MNAKDAYPNPSRSAAIGTPSKILAVPGVNRPKGQEWLAREETLRVMAAIASVKYPHAADLLVHWLNGGSGDVGKSTSGNKVVSAQAFVEDRWFIKHIQDKRVPTLIDITRAMILQGRIDPKKTETQALPEKRWDVAATLSESPGLFLMAGKFKYSVRASVVCKEEEDAHVCILDKVRATVADRYDFDDGRFFGWRVMGGIGVTSEQLNALKKSGQARDFDWTSEELVLEAVLPENTKTIVLPKSKIP